MKNLLQQILNACFVSQTRRSAHYSEAAVQLKIGIELYKRLKVDPIMEMRIPNKKKSEYLDIFIETKTRRRYGIELKYKTTGVTIKGFEYTNQSAQNNAYCGFLKDIRRLEQFKTGKFIDKGFAVFLTNDPYYYEKHCKHSLVEGTIKLSNSYKVRWSRAPENGKNNVHFRYCIIGV